MGNVRQHSPQTENKQFAISKVLFVVGLLISVSASAFGMAVPEAGAATGINRSINYQGRLMDASGNPVTDGVYQITFRLYAQTSGGSQLWSASTTNGLPGGTAASVPVQVKNGLFSVLLGDTSNGQVAFPDNLFNNDSLYLGVKVAADSEMTPRKRLSAVPYAYNSETLQGQYASHTVANTGGDLFGLRQASADAANATRTALYVETKGTSDVYDFLLRMSDGSNDVFSVNRQGNVTVGGILDVNGQTTLANASATSLTLSNNLWVSGAVSSSHLLYINATGTNLAVLGFVNSDLLPRRDDYYELGSATNRWKGLYAVSVTSTNVSANYVNAVTVSTTNLIVNGAAVTTSVPTWQQVTNQGNTTNKDVQFSGGTSTADFHVQGDLSVTQLADLNKALFINATGTNLALIGYVNSNLSPMVDNFYSLGDKTHRWKRLYNLDMYASGTVLTQDFGVYGNLSLPNDSITDLMANNSLTIDATGNVSATSINSGVLGNAGVTLNLSGFGSVTGTLPTSQIMVASTGTVVGPNLQQWMSMIVTNGRAFGGNTIQTASGTIQVGNGEGIIASDPTNPAATVYYVSWATSSPISVPLNQWQYVYLHYENGNTTVVATSTEIAEDEDWTYYPISKVFNDGYGVLEIHDERSIETRPINRILDFLEEGIGQTVTDGCIITDVGTRNLKVSQCTNWYSAYERTIPAFDSSAGGTFYAYYRNGSGGFVKSVSLSQWDNLNYDDGSGVLQPLGLGEYGVQWVYMGEHGRVKLLYGRDSYADVASAEASSAPDSLPDEFLNQEHVFLIGALVYEQGSDIPLTIRDLRPRLISHDGVGGGGSVTVHNDLSGLQGGTTGEYFHLKSTGFDAAGALGFSSALNNDLSLSANGTGNNKVIINNTFAGRADLDLVDGNLLLASTTRITNAGYAYLTGLDMGNGDIINAAHLTVTASSSFQALSFTYGTGTYLYLPGAKIDSLASQYLNAQNAVLGRATTTYATNTHLYTDFGVFDHISAEEATFTHLVVMENTDIHNLTFTNATGGNLVTYGAVSSTFINVLNSILGYATSHNMVVDESLRVGVGSFPIIGNSVAQFGGDTDDYLQVNIQNHSTGTSASSDFVATADNGDDSNYYIDMGINSSNYMVPEFSISGPNDGYLYTHGANLTIGTASASTAVIFHAGGTLAENEIMRLTSDGYVGIGTSNPSSTLDVVGDGRFTGLLTLNNATATNLFWGSATGSVLSVSSRAYLPAQTLINNTAVCLLDGTNCPSGTTPNLQTVTNTGNSTTNSIQFAGGTSTGAFHFLGDLTVDGGTSLQNLLFTHATGLSMSLMEMVSTTRLVSGDAILANTTMQNATASNMVVIDSLRVGVGSFPIVGNSVAQYGGTLDGYLQVNIQNHSASSISSSDFVATADNGDDSNYFIDMGINSSNYDVADFSVQGANDGYLYVQGANLTIGTASASTAVIFHAGGTLAEDEVMRITSDHYVGIGTTNPSSTLDVVGDGRFTGLLTLNAATTSDLFWGNATGTTLRVTSLARLPSNTLINNTQVCLADGTNCPSGASPNLQTVSNSGNTTTRALQFGGGTSTGSFRFLGNLTVDGGTSLQNLLFTHATGLSLSLMEMVSTTQLFSGDAILVNTTMQNATASNMVVIDALRVGTGNVPIVGNSVAQFGGNFNDYLQVNLQNRNSGPLASSDYVATADIGDDSNYFMDMGIANSGFNDSRWDIIKPLDGYLYSQGGDLDLGATSGSTNIIMFAGGVASSNEIMRITSSHYVGIGTTNPSSTLDVVGTGRFTGLLTLKTATTSDLFWGHATGTTLRVTSLARLPSNTLINNKQVCLADGTNCPSGTTPNLQVVTNTGNSTTNAIQFAGGTSTGSFRPGTTNVYDLGGASYYWRKIFVTQVSSTNIDVAGYLKVAGKTTLGNVSSTNQTVSGYLNVAGKTTLANASGTNLTLYNQLWASTVTTSRALFINATGTNLALAGRVNSNLIPMRDNVYSLGSNSLRWANLFANNVSSTNGLFLNTTTTRLTVKSDLILTDGTNKAIFGKSAFPNRVASTDPYGITTYANGALKSGLITEVNGTLLSFAINATQLGNRTTSTIGAIFRMDTRSGTPYWSLKRQPIGGNTEVTDFQITPTGNFAFGAGHASDVPSASVGGLVHLFPSSPNTKGLIIQGQTGQTANLTEWWNGAGSILGMVDANGNMGLGVSSAAAKLEVNGTVKIDNAPSKSQSYWTNSNLSAVGINSVRSLAVFNDYLYAGQGDNAGDGDVQVCNPAGGGSSTLCDNAADWSLSLNNGAAVTRVNTLTVYRGRLYEGEGNGTGVVRYCRPELTGDANICEAADWATSNFPAGPTQIRQLLVYNGFLYAANDTGAAGSASVAVCNPAGGGNVNDCDNAADWTKVAIFGGTYEEVPTLAVYLNRLYALPGNTINDNDPFACNPALGGDPNRCDVTADWTRYNIGATYNSFETSAVYNGYLYFGMGNTAGSGDVNRCQPDAASDRVLCDSATDITTVINNAGSFTRGSAMAVYDGSLFMGFEGATGEGEIIEYNESFATTTNNGTGFEATYSFVNYKGVLYAGRGNAAGNGSVWYYQKPRTASYNLLFAAGSSTGSVWFSNESLNYPGEGTPYEYQVGAFKFSHGIITDAGAYDLAESYPTQDSSLRPGDVVALDENNPGMIRKSSGAYDKKTLGVISTKAGFTLSGPQDGESRPVALIGRVPVKISGENGDVAVGDPLTSASLPGYAMKATRPGMVIGHALESFASSTLDAGRETWGVATGTVMMVVQAGYFFGDDSTPVGQLAGFFGESTSTQIIQQAFQGDTYAISQVAGGIVNPQVADGSILNGSQAANIGTLIVRTAALVAGDLTVGGTSKLMGHVVLSDDSAGVVDLPVGEQYVEIRFAKPYESAPVVVVTPESDAQEYFQPWMGKFRVGDKTINGFRIYVDDGACLDPNNCGRTMRFNWMAVGIQSQTSDESASSTSPILDTNQATSTDATIGSEPPPETTDSSPALDGSSVTPTSTQETVLPDQIPSSDTDSASTDTSQSTDAVEQTPAETVTTQPTEETVTTIPETTTSNAVQTTEGGETL